MNMKQIIKDKKILIIWLWHQGRRVVEFLIGEWLKDNIIWVCKTDDTKSSVEKLYGIEAHLDYKKTIQTFQKNIACVFLGVKPEYVQEEIYLHILTHYPDIKVLIEKAFIQNKSILRLLRDGKYTHWIVIHELWVQPFFKKLQQIDTWRIKNIIIHTEVNNTIFSNIVSRRVFLLSYVFDYIRFLRWENMELLKITKKRDWEYDILFRLDWVNIRIIFVRNIKITATNTSVRYELRNGEIFLYNNNSPRSFLNGEYLDNFSNGYRDYFRVFLKEKIRKLMRGEIHFSDDIDDVMRFRKMNTLSRKITFEP